MFKTKGVYLGALVGQWYCHCLASINIWVWILDVTLFSSCFIENNLSCLSVVISLLWLLVPLPVVISLLLLLLTLVFWCQYPRPLFKQKVLIFCSHISVFYKSKYLKAILRVLRCMYVRALELTNGWSISNCFKP